MSNSDFNPDGGDIVNVFIFLQGICLKYKWWKKYLAFITVIKNIIYNLLIIIYMLLLIRIQLSE